MSPSLCTLLMHDCTHCSNFPAFMPYADILWADIYPVDHHWSNGLQVAQGIELLRNKSNEAGFRDKRIVRTHATRPHQTHPLLLSLSSDSKNLVASPP